MQVDQPFNPEIHRFWTEAFDTQAAGIRSAHRNSEKIQFWDKQIASLSSLLALAKSNRDAIAVPILKLPSEILLEISQLVVESQRIHGSYRGALKRSWLGLSYVCRTWRRILLETPGFWDDFPIKMHPLWELFRKRGNSVSLLHLHGDLEERLIGRVERALGQSQHRIKSISFAFIDDDSTTSLLREISDNMAHFPNLSHLKLTYENGKNLTDEYQRASLPLLRTCLSHVFNAAPNLRDIYLEAFIFPWDVVLPNLRSLKVSALSQLHNEASVSSHFRPPFDVRSFTIVDMAKCLSTMPLLEELHLSDFHTSSIVPNTQPSMTVRLPLLQSLRLSAVASHSYGLWQLLNVNPNTSVFIQGTETHPSNIQLETTFSNVVSYINGPDCFSAISLSVEMPDRHQNYASRTSSIGIYAEQPKDQIASFSFQAIQHPSLKPLQTLLIQLIRSSSVPFGQLQHLSFHRLESLSKEIWTEILSAVPHLQTLCVNYTRIRRSSGHPVACLLSALAPSKTKAGRSARSRAQRAAIKPLVPELQHLEISYAYYGSIDFGPRETSSVVKADSRENLWEDTLTIAFKARLKRGYPLSKLSIRNCKVTPTLLEDWRQIVTEVTIR